MTGKSVGVEQKPIIYRQDSAGNALTTTAHHLPDYSVRNCTLDLKKWVSVSRQTKPGRSGTNEPETGVRPIVHCLKGLLATSPKENTRLEKTQFWAVMSPKEREELTEMNNLFDIEFMYAYSKSI